VDLPLDCSLDVVGVAAEFRQTSSHQASYLGELLWPDNHERNGENEQDLAKA
jgi:hypothetical protein